MTPEQIRILNIFMPLALQRVAAAGLNNQRFVHYTSAEAAISMITHRQVWMRKAVAMNDFSEIDYGRECLVSAYRDGRNDRLKSLIEPVFPGLMLELQKNFDGWYPDIENDTFITCMSEHDPEEDVFGRLSMWRAYGGNSGVGIVLNNNVFLSSTDALKAYSSPVAYLSKEDFAKQFDAVVHNIEVNFEEIKKLGYEFLYNNIFNVFLMAVVCTKHPGFREEREWRIIYTPKLHQSDVIESDIKIVRGVPQVIQKIPLRDMPERGLDFVSIPKLVDRIIIGPSQYPSLQWEVFVDLLSKAGFEDAKKRVVVSSIPLRT